MPGDEPDTKQQRDWALIGLFADLAFLVLLSLIWQITDFIADGRLDALEPWQIAISALVGFTGLIITTGLGFYFSIRAREHQAELDRERDDRLREQDMRATANALAVEVDGLVDDLERARRVMGPDGREYYRKIARALINNAAHFPVFDASVRCLGHLPPDVVAEIGTFYRSVRRTFVSIAESGVPDPACIAEDSIFVTTPVIGKALAERLAALARNETHTHPDTPDA